MVQKRKLLVQAWTRQAPNSRAGRWMQRGWIAFLQRSGGAVQWLMQHIPGVPRQPAHLLIGERGEDIVFWHLQREGWKVIARRWRSPQERGDLDLVAMDGSTLCFVEVKTRTSRGMVPAQLAVDQSKRRMLRSMARLYLRSLPQELRRIRTRFDVVAVYLIPGESASIEMHRNVFDWRERRHFNRDWD